MFVGVHAFLHRNSAFGKFAADVDLQQAIRRPVCALGALLQFFGKLHPVQRVDEAGLVDEVFDLVRLQMSDKVPVGAVDQVVLVPELLHLIFADVRNASRDRLVDLLGRARLCRRNERDLFAAGVPARNFA